MSVNLQDREVGRLGDLGVRTESMLAGLMDVPGLAVSVVSTTGQLLIANAAYQSLFLEGVETAAEGHRLDEIFPPDWAAERIALVTRVANTRQSATLREVWLGRQILTTVQPLENERAEIRSVMFVSRAVSRDDLQELECEVIDSKFIELGPLSSMTNRELTVLTLVGQGYTLKEIAERLGRSFKTIDNHRASIGKKLRQNDRVALSMMASRAGLVAGDEDRQRVVFAKRPR